MIPSHPRHSRSLAWFTVPLLLATACGGRAEGDAPQGGLCHGTITQVQASNVDPTPFDATDVGASFFQGDTTFSALHTDYGKRTPLGRTEGTEPGRGFFLFIRGTPLSGKVYTLLDAPDALEPDQAAISYSDGPKGATRSWTAQQGTLTLTATGASSWDFAAEVDMMACHTCNNGNNPAQGTFHFSFQGHVDNME